MTDIGITEKYRPTKLDEVIGNEIPKKIITNNINSITPPKTYLIHGPRGSGKTTLARILANLLGGVGFDIVETQIRGIEDTQNLKEELPHSPLFGRSKVFILDELQHLRSKDSQDDLLKPLENPPKHVYFVLCTTEPQKITNTILSRCIKIKTVPLTDKESLHLLNKISSSEGEELDGNKRSILIEYANGLPRDLITGFASVRGLTNPTEIRAALELSSESEESRELIKLIVKEKGNNWPKIAKALKNLPDEPEAVRRGILGFLNSIILSSNAALALYYAKLASNFTEPYYDKSTAKSLFTLDCLKAVLSRRK